MTDVILSKHALVCQLLTQITGCRSFKGWQKNAIIGFLSEQNIKVGKPNDFIW